MLRVTLDTCLLITFLDKKQGANLVDTILKLHLGKKIKVFVSNRIFEPDTVENKHRQEQFEKLLRDFQIEVEGSIFRFDLSSYDGGDVLSGGPSLRSEEEIELFTKIVGSDPTFLHKDSLGKRLSNKLGDYDALMDHYCSKRDVFITLDTKDYLHKNKRSIYEDKLGLIIKSPEEFITEYKINFD